MPRATATPTLAVDPVCGMKIDTAGAVGTSLYKGEMYHFCSRGCETKFDNAPEHYAGAAAPEGAACCSSSCCGS